MLPVAANGRDTVAAQTLAGRVRVCGALCAFGATLGVLVALAEIRFHFPPLPFAVCGVAIACGLGALGGLWSPGWLIRRRIRAERGLGRNGDDDGAAPPVDLEYAASFVSGVLIATALTWALLCIGALFLEDLRRFLALSLILPAGVRSGLICGAAFVALFGATLSATVALVALHGWYRVISAPLTDIGRLWRMLLLSSAAGAAIAVVVDEPAIRALLALLAIVAAGVVASRRDRPLALAPRETDASAPRAPLGIVPLSVAGLAAFGLGAVLLRRLAAIETSPADAALALAVTAGGAWLGVVIGRAAAVRFNRASWVTAPACLAALAAIWVVIETSAASGRLVLDAARLAAAGAAASICIVTLGRPLARRQGGLQRALVALGGAAIIGLMSAALVNAFATRNTSAARPADRPSPLSDAIRGAAERRAFAPAVVRLPGMQHGASDADAWAVDLSGPRHDLLWVQIADGCVGDVGQRGDDLRRVLRRCSAALLRRGRLVLELPAEETYSHAAFDALLSEHERERARIVRVHSGEERLTLLLLGGQAESWWATVPLPPDVAATLEAVPPR